MRSFFRRLFSKPLPPVQADAPDSPRHEFANPANPAVGRQVRLTVTGPVGSREEQLDLVEILARALDGATVEYQRDGGTLTLRDSGFELRPGLVSFQPNDDLSMTVCSTIGIRLPGTDDAPFFEYQHSRGTTGALALEGGFAAWTRLDLPVLLDSGRSEPQTCTALKFQFPGRVSRRALLGPVELTMPKPADADAAAEGESHPEFCPCCLLTNCLPAFKEIIASDAPAAIRFYACRGLEAPMSDCRVNGEDYPAGAEALIRYVQAWPGSGFQARKQYILIQGAPGVEGEFEDVAAAGNE